MNEDLFDNGTPKYQSATDIYEAVQAMASGEEIGILSEMFADVSWENQDYYYADNGGKLEERWEELTDYGEKLWWMDVAAWQMDGGDANDWMYEILWNDDLAKRIGFKKIFVDIALGGNSCRYKAVTAVYAEALQELDCYGFMQNFAALEEALKENGVPVIVNPYSALCSAVYEKLKGLRLDAERQLIAESRAMLTAYDDFMFGLKSNQQLFSQQETMYQHRVAELKAQYDSMVQALLASAQAQGMVLELPEVKRLEEIS